METDLSLDRFRTKDVTVQKIKEGASKIQSLSSGKIPYVPREIIYCTSLQTFSLHACKLKRIPQEIGQLRTLRRLDLSCNELTDIPKEVLELPLLEYFSIGNNNFKEPVVLEQLKKRNITLVNGQVCPHSECDPKLPQEHPQLNLIIKVLQYLLILFIALKIMLNVAAGLKLIS
jgi:Leucine-rich repeat (LRR) protein